MPWGRDKVGQSERALTQGVKRILGKTWRLWKVKQIAPSFQTEMFIRSLIFLKKFDPQQTQISPWEHATEHVESGQSPELCRDSYRKTTEESAGWPRHLWHHSPTMGTLRVALHGLELIYHLTTSTSKPTFILLLFLICTPSQGKQTLYDYR